MKKQTFSRRQMLLTTSTGALAAMAPWPLHGLTINADNHNKLALAGGAPVRQSAWTDWPVWNRGAEDDIITMLRSGQWWRGNGGHIEEFERKYASLIGARHCLATASGTTALLTAMHVLDIDAGDEVIVSPYTFIATYNAVLMSKALPVFADTDPETFLIDPATIESRINDRTKAILPVHIYGLPVDMDAINSIAEKHGLAVVEDACQAWLAEYKNKKCGTLGDLGCFSFQNSKHIPAGEGGAVVGNDENLIDRCYAFHNCGRPHGTFTWESPYPTRGSNKRMQQFQALILLSQMERAEKDAALRLKNALYLDKKLKGLPGIIPYKPAKGATKAVFHLYPFRYKKEVFNHAPKKTFINALRAEGIPCAEGYGPQNTYGLIEEALSSRGYKRLFSKQRLDEYREKNHLPGNNQLCEEAVCFSQQMLLGNEADMDDIVGAVTKIYENKDRLN